MTPNSGEGYILEPDESGYYYEGDPGVELGFNEATHLRDEAEQKGNESAKERAKKFPPPCIHASEPNAVYIQRAINACKTDVLDWVGWPMNWFQTVKATALAACQTKTTEFAQVAMDRRPLCGA